MAERIIGRLQTPMNEYGKRLDVHLITSSDAVITPDGQTLAEIIKNMEDKGGIIVSRSQPTFACTWFKTDDGDGDTGTIALPSSTADIMNTTFYVDPGDVAAASSDEPIEPFVPAGEEYPEADGSSDPVNGIYDYYQIVPAGTDGALLVVDDGLTGMDYDPTTMIHKSMVIKDIPNIESGYYVKYYHVSVDDDLYRINGGTADTVI